VHYDPWLDQHPLRIWDGPQLADQVDQIGATVLVCDGRLRRARSRPHA